jgi:hypothetical protein
MLQGFLPFWAANMVRARGAGFDWFGFRYGSEQWARLEALAGGISAGMYRGFLYVNAALFIVFAAILVVGFMVPVLTALSPDPALLSPVAFFAVLAVVILVSFAIGLPLSMTLASRLVAWGAGAAFGALTAEDERLAGMVRWQILRMALFVAAIAFALIGIAIGFGIDLDPWLVLAVRICNFGLSLGTLVLLFTRRRRA